MLGCAGETVKYPERFCIIKKMAKKSNMRPVAVKAEPPRAKEFGRTAFLLALSALFYAIGAMALVQALLIQLSFGLNGDAFFFYLLGFLFFSCGKLAKSKMQECKSC